MKKALFKSFVELTGNPVSSALLKSFTSSRLSLPFVKPFSNAYRINNEEMEYPISHYKSLQALFTRSLHEGARHVDSSPNTLTSPVDGVVSGTGKIAVDQTFLIKGHQYRINEIMGTSDKAAAYKDGTYYILYLSPSHYHHFHYPVTGELVSRYALGGVSYPVNSLGLRLGQSPFSTNHRLISEVMTDFGKVAIVKVGALNVNSIQLLNSSKECIKGNDFGYFSFGSTVILFLENNPDFTPTVELNSEVHVGQPIGKWNQQ
ncbi:phosphatidylserine decarboxylase [Sporosarcina sp. ANT_H38]|uniref:archaetidylserine decarboxylase n=1 Tax=Sporosarcina sp. ANT_H38 TaxID=2597358 RepID=UPI0011F3098B|nr:archaetidylserine decarboxylase [Sporosarcina sp. ANT_H38]KAA0964885.1 phosphatidylserine decarboxylase [Sporosarcina sp. ANT_H38]